VGLSYPRQTTTAPQSDFHSLSSELPTPLLPKHQIISIPRQGPLELISLGRLFEVSEKHTQHPTSLDSVATSDEICFPYQFKLCFLHCIGAPPLPARDLRNSIASSDLDYILKADSPASRCEFESTIMYIQSFVGAQRRHLKFKIIFNTTDALRTNAIAL
jgi:hypothetical protein